MRTTLEIDDRILAAARSRARARGLTLGQAVSELAAAGLKLESRTDPPSGFPMLPVVPGHTITAEMIAEALDELP